MWDPIGILSSGEPWEGHPAADEYDGSLARLTTMLRDGASDGDCIQFLIDVETKRMGLAEKAPPGSTERLVKVVSALRCYVEELDGP